jgi:hypothetical protein
MSEPMKPTREQIESIYNVTIINEEGAFVPNADIANGVKALALRALDQADDAALGRAVRAAVNTTVEDGAYPDCTYAEAVTFLREAAGDDLPEDIDMFLSEIAEALKAEVSR